MKAGRAIALVAACCATFAGQLLAQDAAPRRPLAHDPSMIREGNTYYLFTTGRGIAVASSTDMKNWRPLPPVFRTPPEWAVKAVPGFNGDIWAPDISYHDGTYYLYYSVSAFGKNTSCIGLATNKTLDPGDPRFHWEDHGMVVESIPGRTNWNAIDPNLATDEKGTPYLAFGSFWGGIQLAQLTPDRMKLAQEPKDFVNIASRKSDPSAPNPPARPDKPQDAGGNAIEAPFIFVHDGRYYLFASIDYCCSGIRSDYKMIVGRADKITGPYLDKAGRPLARGGGTILLAGDKAWPGVGHNAVQTFDGVDYLIFHAYDASDRGLPKLRIERLNWKDGWPEVDVQPGEQPGTSTQSKPID